MRMYKKITSILLSMIIIFTSQPIPFLNLGGISNVYAVESTPITEVRYDDFSAIEGLQLNGDFLIVDNAIQFESGGGIGQSVFTKEKIALGENLSFATVFSFRNISPSAPISETEGGFTFTLQPASNTMRASDFHDVSMVPSLSIAVVAEYVKTGGGTTSRIAPMSDGEQIRPIIYAVPYINGEYNTPLIKWTIDEGGIDDPFENSKVWIGYDGNEKTLYLLSFTPSGGYRYFNTYIDLSEVLLGETEVYTGFMGALGDAGNTSSINSWHLKDDLSILDEGIADADAALLSDEMELLEDYPVDFNLRNSGVFGSIISWESSNPDIVDENGRVTPPSLEQGPQEVSLTATIRKESAIRETKVFKLTYKVPDNVIAEADEVWLKDTIILNENDSLDNVVSDLYLPTSGYYGSSINWSSNRASVVDWDGTVMRPDYNEGDTQVTLTASINMNGSIREKTFLVTVKALGMTDEKILEADSLWLTASKILNGNTFLYNVVTDLDLLTKGLYGSTISWTSSDEDIVTAEGKVTRPSYTHGDKNVTLTATLSKESYVGDRVFYVTVKALEQTDAEKLNYDKDSLKDISILLSNTSLDEVVSDLILPTDGPMGSTISWTSSDEDLVTIEGKVTRPSYTYGDKIVTLTATLKLGSLTATKELTVKVIRAEETDKEKLDEDFAWLTGEIILSGNTALNNVIKDLSLPTSGGKNGSTISWTSSDEDLVTIEGKVTRPSYTYGDKIVTLTATLKLGSLTATKELTVKVIRAEGTDKEKLDEDFVWLTSEIILNGNTAMDNVIKDLSLPTSGGKNGSSISWTSSDEDIMTIEGKVSRPTYTQGDKTVTLTASITLGAETPLTTYFSLVIKALDQTPDEQIVYADYEWLSGIETDILNKNRSMSEITEDLYLPILGENGSDISWHSDNEAIVDKDGKVSRPIWTDGDKKVVLTATIMKGLASKEKTFHITVLKRPFTDEEIVAMDYEWLTEGLVLNGNTSLDNVVHKLNFPILGYGVLGLPGSRISWKSSHHGFVALDGTVYRPAFYFSYDPTVTLTASITKGSVSMAKTFHVTVKRTGYNDRDAVADAVSWLRGYNTVTNNGSPYSVVRDLSWPTPGPHDTTITWRSDRADLITHEGKVTNPSYGSGNQKVNVTATVTKGEESVVLYYQYVVLQQPDNGPPFVTGTTPENGSADVPWDSTIITIAYNEDIVLALNHGILSQQGSELVPIRVSKSKDKLTIFPVTAFPSGENRILIPKGAITDSIGLPAEAYELKFTVEEKLVKNIEVISSSPNNYQKDVDSDLRSMFFRFDSEQIVKGSQFETNVTLLSEDGIIPITYSLSGDTVTLALTGPEGLKPGGAHRIIISEGLVQDRFNNKNKQTMIEFMTKEVPASEEIPEIISIYPSDGQTGVSVRPNIEVVFNDDYELDSYPFKLTDSLGKEYPLYAPYTLDFVNTKLIFIPKETLEPNNVYTFSGPGKTFGDPYSMEFSMQFTTGLGPRVTKTSPSTGDWDAPTRGIVEIYFDEPVTRGDSFKDIAFRDFADYPVEFVVEETGNKVVLKSVSELDLYMPYSVYIPSGAYKNSKGVANTQYKITFYTSLERLPYDLDLSYLDVSDMGFVGKGFKLSSDTFNMKTWLNFVRMMGYGPVSYEWYIDGKPVGTSGIEYYNFSSPGKYEITFVAKDKYGFSYRVDKTIEIKDLQDVRLRLKDSGIPWQLYLKKEDSTQPELKFELRLEQENHFIYGERIGVQLYKDGVLQPLSNYGDGSITITSNYNDSVYTYAYQPEYGDDGTYEMVFTYNGVNGQQVIRQSFIVNSKEPVTKDVFRFRLYDNYSAKYYEELNYVYVVLNGEMLRANKEMYTYEGSTFPVYALRKTLKTNTNYDFKVENWHWDKNYRPLYLGKDTDNPTIITGSPLVYWAEMRITGVETNHYDSELNAENNDLYFKGLPTKLVFNAKGDWAGYDQGYYEVATLKTGAAASRYGDSGFKIILTQAHDDESDIQKITVQPGLQLESSSEQYWIRMVSPQGYKSPWEMCPSVWVAPMPSVLGKKLDVSVKDGEYAVNWPTVFNGPIGGAIKALDGIPLLSGGGFGLGGSMPNFEGGLSPYSDIELSFQVEGGYGSSTKTKSPTKYKKVKKVTIVSYEFHIELEGGLNLKYDWLSEEWSLNTLYIMFDASVAKRWDKGINFVIVEVTAGAHVGAGIYGYIELKHKDGDLDYRGIIRLYPNAGLHVDGEFGPYKVNGSLNAILPAEIHFPTGYIGVDFNVDASIKAKSLLWSGTLYEADLYKVHWDNGKERVTFSMLGDTMGETPFGEGIEFQLLSRDYLSQPSNWLGGNSDPLMMQNAGRLNSLYTLEAGGEANPDISPMMESIYPEAEIAFVENGDQQWMVWTDDNPSRDAVNRTQLRMAVYKDGEWSDPEFIYDEGSADFAPSVAAIDGGVLMAWHNIAHGLSEAEGLNEMLISSEISVTNGVYTADGDAPDLINLTNDDKLDHSPMLAANGHNALLVWTKSENTGFSWGMEAGSSLPGDQFYYSSWNNGTWSEAQAIDLDLSTVIDSHLVMGGENALLLYTLDTDHNFSTAIDREVYAVVYDGKTWSEAIQLTHNNVSDYAPKAVFVEGEWFITWLREGMVVYQIGLDGEPNNGQWQDNIQGDYQVLVKEGERPMVALVYTQLGEDGDLGIYASFYDVNYRLWSDKSGLVSGDMYTNAFSAFFAQNGKLHAAYTEADIITEAKPRIIDGKEVWIEGKSISDKVDLKMLVYTPVHDVALSKEDGMLLSTAFPLARTVTTVYTTVHNEGDFTENIVVSLYDGKPDEGGIKVAETAPQLIPAHSFKEVEIEWLVGPEERLEYNLYAVVWLNDRVEEINKDNNTINMTIATSDIAIMNVTSENPAADDYLIEITIANRGSTVLDGAKAWLEDEFGVKIGEIAALQTLELGEKTVLTYMTQSNGRKNIRVRVTLPDGIKEENTDNNVRDISLEPAYFTLRSLNVGPGAVQVDVTSAIALSFNMSIDKGSGFGGIKLLDEKLNEVAIGTIIESNILTIKPQEQLEYGTGYRLMVPADVLGDSYGHALERAINIGFTTVTTNPEIISAYPADRMDHVTLNTVIRLRFNQNVMEGNELSGIVLNDRADGAEATLVPITASIEGELLTIRPVQELNKNTAYILEIPRGAVENSQGETQHEDYLLTFTTADIDDGEDGGGDSGDSGNSAGQPSSVNQQYQASINIDGTDKTIEVRTEDGKAFVELGEYARVIFAGNQQAVVNIPSIPDVNSYTLEMPAEVLSSSGTSSMTINTPLGSVTIPSGMLSNMEEIDGKTAGISIAAGDAAKLPEDVRAAIGDRPILQLTLALNGVQADWNNPSAPIRVSIPYAPTAAEEKSPESIVVWYIDAQGNIIVMPNGYYKQSIGTVSFSTTHFSRFAVVYNKVNFKDVPDSAWYNRAVSFAAAREITLGNGKEQFSPINRLTRGQFITMLMRAYGIKPDSSPRDNFSDAGSTWYTGYLAAAKRLGISKGVGDNLFAPDREITRQELFTLVYSLLDSIKQLPETDEHDELNKRRSLSEFADEDQIAPWAREAITLLVEKGIVQGNGERLLPLNTTTRAEMMQVLYNLMVLH